MINKRLLAALLLIACFASRYSAAPVYADCLGPNPTATPQPTYQDTVLGVENAHLLAYWPLNETGGTTAFDVSGHSRNATYTGPTLNATTFTDGGPAPSFDGVNDYVNLYSAISSVFNGSEGTLEGWAKTQSSLWADTSSAHYIAMIEASSSNLVRIYHSALASNLRFEYVAGGTTNRVTRTTTETTWFHWAITWSASASQLKAYFNGSQSGSTVTISGTWSGALGSSLVTLGAIGTSGLSPWYDNIARVGIWDTALTSGEISTLNTVPSISPTATPYPTCTPSPTLTPSNTPSPTITPSQSPTPTLTPSATFTASPTLSLDLFITLPPPDSTGTPQPGQPAVFGFRFTVGQAGIAVVEVMILFSIWIIFTVIVLVYRRRKTPKPSSNLNSPTL